MKRLFYFNQDALDTLKQDSLNNINNYDKDSSWVGEYFNGQGYSLPTNIFVNSFDLIKPAEKCSAKEKLQNDIENSIIVYSALKDKLKVSQAADERLWAYMTHVEHWDYMRLRWPVNSLSSEINESIEDDEIEEAHDKKPHNRIITRYFFKDYKGRALVRNGLARLWWYGYMTYDEKREDPFELTRIMLRRSDDAQNLLERSFPHNKIILRAILSALSKYEYINRDTFRNLLKSVNRMGGVTVLDTLEEKDLLKLIDNKLIEFIKSSTKHNTDDKIS